MEKIRMELIVQPEKNRYIGKYWKVKGMAVVTMKKSEHNPKAMKAKNKLENNKNDTLKNTQRRQPGKYK